MYTTNVLPYRKSRLMSRKMKALQHIFRADPKLAKAVQLFVDPETDCIFWEMIFRLPLTCGQKEAVKFAYCIWEPELSTRSNLFEDGLDMNAALKCAVLEAIAIRWGLRK